MTPSDRATATEGEDAASELTPEKPEAGVADGAALADDASRAPEEESQSQLPGDPREPHE